MQSVDLLDSLKFRRLLDELAVSWSNEQEGEARLILASMAPYFLNSPAAKAREAKPRKAAPKKVEPEAAPKKKRGRPPKAKAVEPDPEENTRSLTMTPAEAKRYAELADKAAREVPDVHARMDRFMSAHVRPLLNRGQSRIPIPDTFEGRPLPSSNKTWLAALARIGIQRDSLDWGSGADGLPLEAAGSVSVRILKL